MVCASFLTRYNSVMDIGGLEKQVEIIKKWLGTGSINLLGIQFSGKDTQGQLLAKIFGGKLVGGGDILRNSKRDDVKKVIDTGILAPQNDYLEMVLPYFSRAAFDGKPLILSAVGRWQGEEQSIMEAATESGHPLKAAILLRLGEEEVWKRWKIAREQKDRGKRVDDTSEGLKTRLREYKDKTLPVIEFYRQKGLLVEINGELAIDAVTKEIINKLLEFSNRNS